MLSTLTGSIQTINYMAPEIILREPYDEKADLWSLGCIAYEMLNGRHPFDGQGSKQLRSTHQHGSYFCSPDYERDPVLASIVDELLSTNVSRE